MYAGIAKSQWDMKVWFAPNELTVVNGRFASITRLTDDKVQFVETPEPRYESGEVMDVIKSSASNGSWTFYIIENGSVYLSKHQGEQPKLLSQIKEMRQVHFGNGVFLFLASNSKRIYKLVDEDCETEKCKFEDVSSKMGLQPGRYEFVLKLNGGIGGFIYVSNMTTTWVHVKRANGTSPMDFVREPIDIGSIGLLRDQISRVEMSFIPIFYMTTGEVYGYKRYKSDEYGCASLYLEDLKTKKRTKFRQIGVNMAFTEKCHNPNITGITRFIPYAETRVIKRNRYVISYILIN